MKYFLAIIGFVSVLYVGNYFAENTFYNGFYDENKELIKSTIYFIAFIAALFGYNLIHKNGSSKLNNASKLSVKYGYVFIGSVGSIWLTTFIIANFFIRASITHRYELTVVQIIVAIAVSVFGLKYYREYD